MIRKLALAPALLGLAGVLLAANTAFAQRGGHGGGHASGGHGGGHASYGGGHSYGSAHVGSSHYSGGHSGSAYHGGAHNGGAYSGSYYRGYSHPGYYGNRYYPGFLGAGYYPGLLGGYYPYGGYGYGGYGYPSYSYGDYDPPVTYYDMQTSGYTAPPVVANDSATIRVIVPDPQARVWFDGNPTQQTGTERYFHSPSLTFGSSYNYTIRASWMQNGREVSSERTVGVVAGQTTVVDFTRS